ncbi:hypothetical protein R6Q59_035257 [Mikania micrantha]
MIVVITWLIKVVRDMALYKHGISPYETYSWQRRRLGGAPETWWTAGGGGGGGSNLMERSFITILSHSHSLVFLVRIELFLGLGFYSESILQHQHQHRGDEIQANAMDDDLGCRTFHCAEKFFGILWLLSTRLSLSIGTIFVSKDHHREKIIIAKVVESLETSEIRIQVEPSKRKC